METKIGLSKKDLELSVKCLNHLLADQKTLYTKTQNFHWNVSGNSYMELHKLFEKQYDELAECIDQTAERIVQLDAVPLSSMKEFLAETSLQEAEGKKRPQDEMLKTLLEDHRHVATEIRKSITETIKDSDDEVTRDFLIKQLTFHEEQVWILRKYVG